MLVLVSVCVGVRVCLCVTVPCSYVEASMLRLTQRPTTVEDIGRAKKEWKEISDSKAAMKSQFRCVLMLFCRVFGSGGGKNGKVGPGWGQGWGMWYTALVCVVRLFLSTS